jgi:hypothetical protein
MYDAGFGSGHPLNLPYYSELISGFSGSGLIFMLCFSCLMTQFHFAPSGEILHVLYTLKLSQPSAIPSSGFFL